MMLATLLSTPVNAQVVEPVIAYWNSAFEKLLALSSEPSSRCSAMMLALRLSMRAMKLDSTRLRVIASAALKTNTNSTNSTSSSRPFESSRGSSMPATVIGVADPEFCSCKAPSEAIRPTSRIPRMSRKATRQRAVTSR